VSADRARYPDRDHEDRWPSLVEDCGSNEHAALPVWKVEHELALQLRVWVRSCAVEGRHCRRRILRVESVLPGASLKAVAMLLEQNAHAVLRSRIWRDALPAHFGVLNVRVALVVIRTVVGSDFSTHFGLRGSRRCFGMTSHGGDQRQHRRPLRMPRHSSSVPYKKFSDAATDDGINHQRFPNRCCARGGVSRERRLPPGTFCRCASRSGLRSR